MAANSRHGWSRKLRAHVLNHEDKVESKLEDFKCSKPDSGSILLPARPQLLHQPDQLFKYQVTKLTELHFYIILFSYYKPGGEQHAITIHTTPGC